MVNIKTYYAYVALDQIEPFEEQLKERKDKIKNIQRGTIISSEEGILCRPYLIEAEEGTINRKWEFHD